MRPRARMLIVLLMTALLLGNGIGTPPTAPDAEAASLAECTAADPPPQVLSVAADDTVIATDEGTQNTSVTLRSPCGAGYTTGPGCAPPQPCLEITVTMRRTAAATSPAARNCGRVMTEHDHDVRPARPTSEPGVFVAELGDQVPWSLTGDTSQSPITNACAGGWDLSAAVTNTWRNPGTTSAPLTIIRAFSLRRAGAMWGTHADPEPVRAGALVTVRGQLSRRDWSQAFDSPGDMVAFASQPVRLQRRTVSGAYRTVRTVRSDSMGRLLTRLEAPSTKRCYRWNFAGTSTTTPAIPGGDCVAVRR